MRLSSTIFRKNWTFDTIIPEAQPTRRLTFCPSSFLDLMVHLSNLPLRRLDSAMKPAPLRPEKLLKVTWFERPLRVNTLLQFSALDAHAPVRSKACAASIDENARIVSVAKVTKLLNMLLMQWPLHLVLRFDQMLSAPELAGCDLIRHVQRRRCR
jgi:hypothetical protein